jgi:tetratricopeptide (TPR) repeat protein
LSYTPLEIAAQAGRTMTYYFLLLMAPTPRWMHTISLNVLEQAGWWPVGLGSLVLGVAFWLIVRWWRRAPAAAWFMAFTVLAILPVSNFLPLTFLLAAPYRAAFAGFGLAGVLGWAFSAIIEKAGSTVYRSRTPSPPSIPALPFSLLTFLLVWQVMLSVWGAVQWRSESRIFSRFVEYDPDNIVANYIYSFTFDKENGYEQSAELKEKVLTLMFGSEAWRNGPEAAFALRNDPRILRRAMQNQGTDGDAVAWIVSIYAEAGNMRIKASQMDRAVAIYHAGETLRPRDVGINVGLGYCAGQTGNSAEEIRRMRIALQEDSTKTYAHTRLGYAYAKQGEWSAARDEFAIWLKAEPSNDEAKQALEEANKHLK